MASERVQNVPKSGLMSQLWGAMRDTGTLCQHSMPSAQLMCRALGDGTASCQHHQEEACGIYHCRTCAGPCISLRYPNHYSCQEYLPISSSPITAKPFVKTPTITLVRKAFPADIVYICQFSSRCLLCIQSTCYFCVRVMRAFRTLLLLTEIVVLIPLPAFSSFDFYPVNTRGAPALLQTQGQPQAYKDKAALSALYSGPWGGGIDLSAHP